MNGVVGSLIPVMKYYLYLTEKNQYVGSQELTHGNVGSKPHPAPRRFLSKIRPTGSIHVGLPDIGYLFIYSDLAIEI